MVTENTRVGLFMDVENIQICAQAAGLPFDLTWIVDRARQEGIIMSRRAYADWSSATLRPVLGDFRRYAIEMSQLPSGFSNKNTADIQLAVDALEMVLSPVRPATVVIVSGDRDFVPLVQKLQRYGTRVVGIGVEGTVSLVLAQACDAFVFYNDLVPPLQEELEAPTAAPDMTIAYSLMRRATEALTREGRQPVGASVLPMMRQLDPIFDLARYKTTLKHLAEAASEAGYVRLTERPGTDFLLSVDTNGGVPVMTQPAAPHREYDFSTRDTALASYRTILQEQRIPLLPWYQRWALIQHLWARLSECGNSGMSMDEMRRQLLDYARSSGFDTSNMAITKFLYTLNFARCFSRSLVRPVGVTILVPAEIHVPMFPACDEEGARRALHYNYITVLLREQARLDQDAVFKLLHDDAILDGAQRERFWTDTADLCNRLQPASEVLQAYQRAQQREQGGAAQNG